MRVRRRAVRCPPTPSSAPRSRARARTYVPELHSTRTSTSIHSPRRTSSSSRAAIVTGRSASTTGLPGTRACVGSAAVHLDGAHGARALPDAARERRRGGRDRLIGDGGESRGIRARAEFALGVVGRGTRAEPDGGEVLLVEADEVGQQPRRGADAEHEQARGHRVEGSGVADLAGAEPLAGARDDVVARHAARLVDEQDAAGRAAHDAMLEPCGSASSVREPSAARSPPCSIAPGTRSRSRHAALTSTRSAHTACG